MYDKLVKRLREKAGAFNYQGWVETAIDYEKAADAIEKRDRYALTLKHKMMAEAESHKALVERLNKQIKNLEEALSKQNENWEEALKTALDFIPCWVSVTEQLPEMHEVVLVCNEDYGETELGFSEIAVWDGSDWICARDRESRLHFITHWMPLPEPPKGEA